MSNPYGAKAMRSREALQNALLELIEERSFEQISIRDITTRAGVSYPVFFRRYEAKERLLEDVAAGQVRSLLSLSLPIFQAQNTDESLEALCRYVDEHRLLWTRLLTGGAGAIMRDEFKRIAREIGSSQERINPWLPSDLAASFVVSGIFEILAWWLEQPADYPIANVAKLIDTLVVRSTGRPIDIHLAEAAPLKL